MRHPEEPSTEDELDNPALHILTTPSGFRDPLPEADVVLHCGDLTKRSHRLEYESTFSMLRRLRAPLKLVIAGNHDGALDRRWWEVWEQPRRDPHMETPAAVERIIEESRADGVQYLTEGTYTFDLANGARLRVYASPWTPEFGAWGFQYSSEGASAGHDFDIPGDVDVAMTHGPPRGVLDLAGRGATRTAAGCDWLFRAVYRGRPRVHCFGHIHEGWGGYLATWRPTAENQYDITASSVIDGPRSRFLERLPPGPLRAAASARRGEEEDAETKRARTQRLKKMVKDRSVRVDIAEGEDQVRENEQTLFLNAAIMNISYQPTQCPWLVDIDLPRSTPSD